ncbi:undecaprenyldiphospho-muramoylpentapeptide beta-N-acetylglucosaminyltransferase [Fodinibius sediminis]|uniref:UDP-N-acetylglucosamine--N-acetylmuramyl-(pentapeptide) pyrophosphoryl-undecaprenol N-acetylglucosamine transferase n=1 Tax=Fodinibius sediminis TaxID=1214077 RepID=A0A521C5D0_9BACT|nr:undecaprenyldiphospho-muramoylpentapeptide beta-N-acetylglucosaminyltransferase [Fodinibius sediminis]SMO54656.1 UDP-N-acetylglucosamine-N-acetylmuramylpentapeptide N-acetylglucosamine transferase [Fodinibius sediminis]
MHKNANHISSRSGSAAGNSSRILIAAGGTGGHVYPAIAIADALDRECEDAQILFVGTKNHMEWEAVPRAGHDITSIWISGFHRRLTVKNLLFPVKLATSLVQSLRIISSFKPDVVISCGGYAAGPVGWVAARKGIPLVIQEQNSFPGVTNRLLGKHASLIFTAFRDAGGFFPQDKIILAGNPTRKSLTSVDTDQAYEAFGLTPDIPTLLILGGSGGARSINEAMAKHLPTLHDEMQLQIIWQCGERYYDRLREDIHPENYDHLLLTDFLHDMPEAYAVADLVISRAGALSCSELALTGKPSILVPSPNVAGDHQTKNAKSMVSEGAAELIADDQLEETLAGLVGRLITDRQQLKKMQKAALKLARPEASETIATGILELIQKKKHP